MQDELKCCPFCRGAVDIGKSLLAKGSRNLIIQYYIDHHQSCMIRKYGNPYVAKEAIAAWNTRKEPT